MPSLRKRDKIVLLDGSPGHIEQVLKTEVKTIYKVKLIPAGEGYFEGDKIILREQHPLNSILETFSRFFK